MKYSDKSSLKINMASIESENMTDGSFGMIASKETNNHVA